VPLAEPLAMAAEVARAVQVLPAEAAPRNSWHKG
jgi:hypothetical protein